MDHIEGDWASPGQPTNRDNPKDAVNPSRSDAPPRNNLDVDWDDDSEEPTPPYGYPEMHYG